MTGIMPCRHCLAGKCRARTYLTRQGGALIEHGPDDRAANKQMALDIEVPTKE